MLRRGRKYQIVFGLFLLSVIGMFYWMQDDLLFYSSWACAGVCSVASYRLRQVRCPHCRRSVHQYWQAFAYCPYCGKALDEPGGD